MSECYLMHLDRPVCDTRPARHYLGFSEDTVKREQNYRQLQFSYNGRLMLAAVERNIGFTVARVWKNCTKRDEKLLRDLHNNPKLCPICNPALDLVTRINAAGRYQTYRLGDKKRARYGDLALLRGRVLKPARKRQRLDGSYNYAQLELTDADREYATAIDQTYANVTRALGVPARYIEPDVNYASYGFDTDLPY